MAPTRTIFQLDHQPTWYENIAVRANGRILATRIDVPELMEIDPTTGEGRSILTIPGSKSLMGINELEPDVWAVGAGDYILGPGTVPGSYSLWIADLNGPKPVVSLVTKIPEIGLLNGTETWSKDVVLAADSTNGRIYRINVRDGSYSVVLDAKELDGDESQPIGINGLKLYQGWLYFTNTAQKATYRVPVGDDASTTGPVEIVATGPFIPDDLCIGADGTVYVTDPLRHKVARIPPGGSDLVVIAGEPDAMEIAGPTACALGRRDEDGHVLYVSTGGALAAPVDGKTEPAKIVAIDLSG